MPAAVCPAHSDQKEKSDLVSQFAAEFPFIRVTEDIPSKERTDSMRQRIRCSMLIVTVYAAVWTAITTGASVAIAQSFKSFDFPGAVNTQATAINSSGEIVGRYFKADGSEHGFLFTHGLFTHGLFASINVPGSASTDVDWVNARGQIVGTYNTGNAIRGFLLSAGQYTTINYAGLANTFATGISDNGDIVGVGSDNFVNWIGFRLTNGKTSPVAFPGTSIVFQEPTMLETGPIVGDYCDAICHGYLLVGTRFQPINCPQAPGGIYLSGIDAVGRMVGDMITSDGHQHGLLISNGQCIAVDFPGSVSTYANGINAQGDIVGRYTDTNGNTHGFVAEHFAE
jgi:uncharacterized membrane protein